jgi:flagellar biosynthesis protein FliR
MDALAQTLVAALPAEIFVYFAVFVRVGAAMLSMPGLGEISIPQRIRLTVALLVTLVVAPVVGPTVPPLPDSAIAMAGIVLGETLIGVFIGLAGRFAMSAMIVAGAIISQQIALSSATLFDPTFGQQGAAVSAWLAAVALTIVFVTDLHHLMLRAVVDSYTLFPAGQLAPLGSYAEALVRWTAQSFLIGVQISAPFLVFGLVINLALGLIARLQPAIQVFFIAQPALIAVGFLAMGLTLVATMQAFERGLLDKLEPLLLVP